MRKIMATLALAAVVACGGGEGGESQNTAGAGAEQPAAQAAQPAAQGTLHEVRMHLTADGSYAYEPASLTIKQGDRVRWINESGGPHNVAFYGDRVPAGASAALNAAMPTHMGGQELTGALLIAPNETFEMSFAGLPVGTYSYFCTPHEMLGMTGSLTVTQ